MISSDANEVLPGLAADEEVVLLERDEEYVHVEGWEVDLVDVERCYVLREGGALCRGKGIGMSENSPERHGCYVACLPVAERRLLLFSRSTVMCYGGRDVLDAQVERHCPFILVFSAR